MFRFLLKIVTGLVAVILVFVSDAAHADLATGSYLFDFSGIVALWDFSGFYSGGIGPFSIGLSIAANSSGELTGSGGFDLEGLGGEITSVSGSLMGSSTAPHVAVKLKMSGSGNLEGINAKVTFSGNMHYQLNSADKRLEHPSGSGTIAIRDLSNGKSRSESGSFKRSALTALALPTNSTGEWLLFLNLTPDGNAYTGTASIELSTGATTDFTATGTYDPWTDTSKVNLVGNAGKLNLVISTWGATLNVESANGKIFGQNMNYQPDPSSTPTPTPSPTAMPTPIACPNPGAECTAGPVTVTSLAPSSAVAHGPDIPLSVCGCNFTSLSTIEWNGTPLSTTLASANQLNATIPAADTFAVGVENVTVSDNAQTSAPQTFFVGETGGNGFAEVEIDQPAEDIVYDPVNHAIYLSMPNFGSIAVIRFPSASITSSIPAGSGPDALAISDDSSYLYAGIDGAGLIQRFTLPSLARDINYSLGSNGAHGPYVALDLQVAPGAPRTTAVSLGVKDISPSALGGVKIFDDSTPRPMIAPGFGGGVSIYDSLQWGTNNTILYAANSEDTAFDFYTLPVNAMGVSLSHDYPNVFDSFGNRIHFDNGTGLLYADDGQVIDPSDGSVVGTFPRSAAGTMVPDSTLNKAFFAEGNGTIESFNLNEFRHISSITVPNFSSAPLRVIRWGNNGLAIINGPLFLIAGNFVH